MVLSTQPLGVFLGGRDPYKVRGPAVISFSGGRTSAYLLWQCVRRGLDADTHVVFCNTGKERVETLEFVRRCGEEWKVKIRWLEYYRRRLPRYRKREKKQLDVIERAGRTGLYQESGPEDGYVERDFARREPSRVEWWAKEEKRTGSVFNKKLGRMKNLPNFLTLPHIDSFACHCTD